MSSVVVTADMFEGLTNSVSTNAGVIVPIGITIMSIMIGVSLIPRIVYKFI